MISNRLIICADDFGMDEAISRGIVSALEQRRINAVSILVGMQHWPTYAKMLLPYRGKTLLGLHLNFTQGKPQSAEWTKTYASSFYTLPWLIQKCYFYQLDKVVVSAEIRAQIACFFEAFGVFPDFIDGHQHVHQFPGIREALLQEIADFKPMVRNTTNGYLDLFSCYSFPKRQIIALFGGFYFKKMLHKKGFSTNKHFSGIYPFTKAFVYRKYFQQFLKALKGDGLIMCHPGLSSDSRDDPLAPYRHLELAYLLSDDFIVDLKTYGYYDNRD